MKQDRKHAIPLLVHDVAHQFRVLIDGKVEPFRLTRQKWIALSILEKSPGISQVELAERLEIERSSVGRLLDRMEKRGLVFRQKDEMDRRIIRVFMAGDAQNLLDQLEDVSDEIQSVAQKGLSDDEQHQLLNLLQKVQNNLKVGFGGLICAVDLTELGYAMLPIL